MARYSFLIINLVGLVWGFKECSSGSDTAKPTVEFLVTPFFPHRTNRAVKCKYSLSVNYGEYIKLIPDTIELPCAGGNGIYVEEAGGRSGPYCGNKRMPSFVSRDVKFDLHIIIDTPLRGARVKIGYKAVTNSKGPNVAPARRGSSKQVPIAILKMAPDQGQGQLQQQNSQNTQNEILNSQQEGRMVEEPLAPPSINAKGPGHRRGYDPRKEWVSETYNPINSERPKILGEKTKSSSSSGGGVELVLPILFLMILVAILIAVIHKRRQKMKADLKKMEDSAGDHKNTNTLKKDFIPIASAKEKTEPSIEQINHVIKANDNAASIENNAVTPAPKVVAAPSNKICVATNKTSTAKPVPPTPANTLATPLTKTENIEKKPAKKIVAAPTNKIEKKTISTDSAVSTKSKDSQATTAPSIRSECPKPTRPARAPVVRPTRKQNQTEANDDDDRPCY